MGVDVDRNVQFGFQCGEEFLRRIRFQKSGHVLDRKDMTAQGFQFFCLVHIVIKGVFCLGRTGHISGVTDGALDDLARL